jgi:(R,R)-butanediol dehydrogenase / meso-butanediol dehydrogenase / diacetyl reductase
LRREQATKHGATLAIDPLTVDLTAEVMKLTNGDGVDVVFDAAGVQAGFTTSLQCIKKRGVLANVALWEKDVSIDMNLVVGKEITITGAIRPSPYIYP